MAFIILKYDDLNEITLSSFKRAYVQCEKYGCTPSFGLIGSSLEHPSDFYVEELKQLMERGAELWNHGFFHSETEFSTCTYQEQKESIQKTQFFMEKHLGKAAVTFGSPHNNSTEKTVSVLSDSFPEIKNYLFMADGKSRSKARQLLMRCNYEIKTGVIDLDFFNMEYERIKKYPYFVMQGHPSFWTDSDFQKHEDILRRITEDGHKIVTPEQLSETVFPEHKADKAEFWDGEISDFFASHDRVAFYGAGEIGREVFRYFKGKGLTPDAFVVSDGGRKDSEVCGVSVLELSELRNNCPGCGIILTLLGRLHDEVLSQPVLSGFDIWRAENTGDYDRFVDHVRYGISK